jgi:predicted restriction endonuclease
MRGKIPNQALKKYMEKNGSWWTGRKVTEEHRNNLRKSHLGIKLSLFTRQKMSKRMKGKENPNWKGGKTKFQVSFRDALPYKIWREEVFKKDDWTCKLCNKRGGFLHAHHIRPFYQSEKDRLNIKNGLTLCKLCHHTLHGEARRFKKLCETQP